jgi:hypothetical protein
LASLTTIPPAAFVVTPRAVTTPLPVVVDAIPVEAPPPSSSALAVNVAVWVTKPLVLFTAFPIAVTTPVPVVVVAGATPVPPPKTSAFAARAALDAIVVVPEKYGTPPDVPLVIPVPPCGTVMVDTGTLDPIFTKSVPLNATMHFSDVAIVTPVWPDAFRIKVYVPDKLLTTYILLAAGTVSAQVLAFGVTLRIAYCEEDDPKLELVVFVSDVSAVRLTASAPAIQESR